MRVSIVQPSVNNVSETFLRAHAENLPGEVQVIHHIQGLTPLLDNREILSQRLVPKVLRKVKRTITGKEWIWERTLGYLVAFRKFKPDVVLAEYGLSGVMVAEACRIAGIPLVVHFHGFDASKKNVLIENQDSYKEMFQQAAGIIAVSNAMKDRLIQLGAPVERVYLNPYGVDPDRFQGAQPELSGRKFVAVGRFVEKKAPYLTIMAFSKVLEEVPDAHLSMIGDGQLLGVCKDLANALGIQDSVTFHGSQSHGRVAEEMQSARAFIQHSIEASDGDCEGTPNSILEAGATGLPVVSTRHAGISDVVIEGETGLLVDEKDVNGMAKHMIALATDPNLAGRLGRNACQHISSHHSMNVSITRLATILQNCL